MELWHIMNVKLINCDFKLKYTGNSYMKSKYVILNPEYEVIVLNI